MSDEEVRTTSATGGEKGRKPAELAWLDPTSLMEVAAVARMGSDKYGDHNFRRGYEWSKCYNALHRHLAAFWGGEDTDPESGLPHAAHAAWHCLALLSFMREHPEYDDRYKPRKKNLPEGDDHPFISADTIVRLIDAQYNGRKDLPA